MKRMSAALMAVVVLVSAGCTVGTEDAPETPVPPTPTVETPDPTPTVTDSEPELSFQAATYRDESVGFEFDYPSSWTMSGPVEEGDRARIAQLALAGETQLQIVAYRWSPTDDISAYVDNRKQAWDASGFIIESESELALAGDRRGLAFVIRTQEGDQAFFFLTAFGDRYLQLSGENDLELLEEIAGTVRPIDCSAEAEDTVEWVACNVIDGIRSRNLSALHSYMADPFVIAYWGSEGREDSPAGITAELARSRLPADPDSPITFTTDRGQFPPLAGMPSEGMFGPDVDVVLVVYSEGWGPDGLGATLLLIAQDDAGDFYWHGIVYSNQHFDK